MNVLAILQARCSSSRLPGKVLAPILGQAMLARQVERLRRAKTLDRLVVATSDDESDDPLEALCTQLALPCYRGSLTDVLVRFAGAYAAFGSVVHSSCVICASSSGQHRFGLPQDHDCRRLQGAEFSKYAPTHFAAFACRFNHPSTSAT